MPHKLLLADDSVTIQRVIELTFADEDVQVHAVGDGKMAIESIQSDRPDIVLADVGMPERDGYDVAEFIKRNPQLANIPVLLLTGAFEPIDETRARAVGCDGVLVKPFEPQMVINRVKDLLSGRRSGGLWGAKPAPPAHERPAAAPAETAPPESAAPAAATSASLEEYFDRLDAAFASVEAATEARTPNTAMPHAAPGPSTVSHAAAGPSALSTDDFPGWDPDLAGDPHRVASAPAPVQAPPPIIPVVPVAPPAPTPAPAPVTAAPPKPVNEDEKVAPPQPPAAPPIAVRPVVAPPTAAIEPPPAFATPLVAPPKPAPPAAAPSAAAPTHASAGSMPSLAEAFAALLSAEQDRRVSPSKVGSMSMSDEAMDEIVRKVIERMTDTAVREAVIDVAERLVREEIEQIKRA
jgi:CheY-like chemotaxis protein